jgi:Kef-type K+ transport system membrane component KefB/mannitol/fructose-specific phosphotransferase system IIA component (Ntr-type)
MSEHDAFAFLLALAILLGAARLLGELVRRLGMPLVVGEISAGIVVGPTVLGKIAPRAVTWLFSGAAPKAALNGYMQIAAVLLLVVSGVEVDIALVKKRGRSALLASSLGVLFPMIGGALLASLLPDSDLVDPARRGMFVAFLGIALSISALPVIAKTLLDLGLFKTDVGLLVMSAAMIDDLVGWIAFSLLLAPMHGGHVEIAQLGITLGGVAVYALVCMFAIRPAIHRLLAGPSFKSEAGLAQTLSLVVCLALFGGAITQALGVHAVLGAFLVGIAVGDSKNLRERTRVVIHDFVTNVFAPVFFAGLGLRVDFAHSFDLRITLLVVGIATGAKVLGCSLGARFGGLAWRESWAVGFGLNARGAMEIILALLALEAGVIKEPIFVALVVMAIVTSLVSGPMMKRLLYKPAHEEAVVLLQSGAFVPRLQARTSTGAIEELIGALAGQLGPLETPARDLVVEREALAATGLGDDVAIPHAAIPGLTTPLLALGRAPHGIDFDAPDGRPSTVIFLLLMPPHAYKEEVGILASIARATFDEAARLAVHEARNMSGVVAVLQANATRIKKSRNHFRSAASLTDI